MIPNRNQADANLSDMFTTFIQQIFIEFVLCVRPIQYAGNAIVNKNYNSVSWSLQPG